MKKLNIVKPFAIMAVSAALVFGTTGFAAAKSPTAISTSANISIYFSPHGDDETLTYSVPILNDLRAGKKVIVVLLSEGEESTAINPINKRLKKEGRKPLTVKEFGQARIHDFHAALAQLGIPASQQYVYHLKNDDMGRENVVKIVKHFQEMYPNATFKGMSETDIHPDHALTGSVINEFYKQHKIKREQTFASIYMARFSGKKIPATGEIYLKNKRDAKKIDDALSQYEKWDPKHGFYNTGGYSVPSQFKSMHKSKHTQTTSR